MLAISLLVAVPATAGIAAARTSADEPISTVTITTTTTTTTVGRYHGLSASKWAQRYKRRTRQLQAAWHATKRLWQPTITYALRLASAVTGVPYTELAAVSWCESRHNPFAVNGQYRGIFQMHWQPFGFSPYDPVASALSAAMTVQHDGGWRQWECKP